MIALRKHCLFYGINRDVLFNERSGLQISGALLYALELGTAFLLLQQFIQSAHIDDPPLSLRSPRAVRMIIMTAQANLLILFFILSLQISDPLSPYQQIHLHFPESERNQPFIVA